MDYAITLPSKPRVVSEDETKGTYEIDGLYAGYGHTLGNSLRRIILSSMPGAAVTSIKIEGVPHEFSTIPGVKEDVITILLHLKKVRFKMHTDEPQQAKISVKGAKNVTGKDIVASSELEVLNKDEHIATLTNKDAKIVIDLTIEKGLGYISRDVIQRDRVEIGTIFVDAIFTPIRRVNYEVENMRVGDRTDYNRLRIFIETDGIISPREALEKSIETMIEHLRAVVGFKEHEEKATQEELSLELGQGDEPGGNAEDNTETLKTRIEDLQISSRTLNTFSKAGIRTIGGLVRKKEADLLKIEGVGKKAIQEVKRALGNYGLTLK